jgi:hypothetical protein
MIVTGKRTEYDGSWRLIQYDTDEEGRAEAQLAPSHLDDVIDSYYVQREKEFHRLHAELLAAAITPIGFFMRWQHMTVPDVAARMKLRQSTVKAHLTPKGFERIDVRTLRRYARIFDVSVGDFFQFTELDGDLSVDVQHSADRLVQHVKVAVKP